MHRSRHQVSSLRPPALCVRRLLRAALLLLTACAAAAAGAAQVHDVRSRGQIVRLLIDEASTARAVFVLFAGGHGALRLGLDGDMRWGRGNFLVRSRHRFNAGGLTSVLIDAPTDKQHPDTGLYGFRTTPAHRADIAAVIAWLRDRYKLPVWLAGTSRGTVSVAHAAAGLGHAGPDGIVLSAAILGPNRRGSDVLAARLHRIRIPVLIAHHRNDACPVTPYAGVAELRRRLVNAPRVSVLSYSGGNARGRVCGARHYHGFNGIEAQVVAGIAARVLATRP